MIKYLNYLNEHTREGLRTVYIPNIKMVFAALHMFTCGKYVFNNNYSKIYYIMSILTVKNIAFYENLKYT